MDVAVACGRAGITPTPPANQTIKAIANKLSKAFFFIMRDGVDFDVKKLVREDFDGGGHPAVGLAKAEVSKRLRCERRLARQAEVSQRLRCERRLARQAVMSAVGLAKAEISQRRALRAKAGAGGGS